MDTLAMVLILILFGLGAWCGSLAAIPSFRREHPAASVETRRDWFAKKGRALYHEVPA
jgi:hypothetical protein